MEHGVFRGELKVGIDVLNEFVLLGPHTGVPL